MVIATVLLGMQRSSGFTKIESSVTKGQSFQNVARSLRELSAGNTGPHDGRRLAHARSLLKLSAGTAGQHDRRRLAHARSLRELSAGTAGPHDGRRHARARSLRKLSLRSHARCESFPPAPPALMTDSDLRTPAPARAFRRHRRPA